jgi:hypothetical protein
MPPLKDSDVARFWAGVIKTPGCWVWRRATNQGGYGQFHYGGHRFAAHRISLLIAGNPPTQNQEVDHLCRVRACVRPDHLESVSKAENIARAQQVWIDNHPQEYLRRRRLYVAGFR